MSLVPYIAAAHEVKTKPTQHSVKELRSFGIQPDIIVLRSDHHIDDAIRGKIASFCDVDTDCVFTNETARAFTMFRSCLPSRTLTCVFASAGPGPA